MAIKSFFISLILTIFFGYSFTIGLTTKDSFLQKIPDWGGFTILIGGGMLYILAFWWGLRGFPQHKLLSLMSLGMSGFGLACYAVVISMQLGKGKPYKGQFDYDLSKIPAKEQAAVRSLAKQIGVPENEIHATEYWKLREFPMAICIQKGHVIGVNVNDKAITDVSVLSALPELSGLYLKGTHLKDLSDLQSPKLNRLELQQNDFTDLTSFSGLPNVEWLFIDNNQLKTLEGIEQMPKLKEKSFSGNPDLKDN
ncbi:leucine-rich repeat domain-containing protein [Emticicia sp. C21]|uniref:leucine-rich repeat domain-containing protein n=1 Tax=Emticicia sp. C21 TaxID=2302915 RepID=UPI000E34D815|nr:leucine-rich repeat domain-containing protein [Emticicia sp. C21]RFS16347.1 leucine-rich repeat domain-containing protein [Emticicia sp. C21]